MKYWILMLVMLTSIGTALGDDYRPAYIELNQVNEVEFELAWKVPAIGEDLRLALSLDFSADVKSSEPIYLIMGGAHIERRRLTNAEGWVGTEIRVLGLEHVKKDVLARIEWLDGTIETTRLTKNNTAYTIEGAPSFLSVVKTYTIFGVEHILEGNDHLLFIACLVFIAGSIPRILVTITGFTIAHSITLIISALGWVELPLAPVEAIIALSIAFLAREIILPNRDTLTWRHPIVVSSAFGLLHGFGFAAALTEVGLPQAERIAALVAFNVGVEVGQILFVIAYLSIAKLVTVKHIGINADLFSVIRQHEKAISYFIIVVSMYWTFDRIRYFWL